MPNHNFPSHQPSAPYREYEYHDREVTSSVLIGTGASGGQRLFTIPQGQPIPRMGAVPPNLFPTHTPLTTDIVQAGQLGSSIGDMSVKAIRLDFIGAWLDDIQAFLEVATFRFKVAGRLQYEAGARDLPKRFRPSIPVDRTDTVEAWIEIEKPIVLWQPLLIRVVLSGLARFDIR